MKTAMRKKITFVVFSDSSSKVNQITFSRASIIFTGLLVTAVLIFSGTMVLKYFTFSRALSDNKSLRLNVTDQLSEIESQREQIRIFAHDIKGKWSGKPNKRSLKSEKNRHLDIPWFVICCAELNIGFTLCIFIR